MRDEGRCSMMITAISLASSIRRSPRSRRSKLPRSVRPAAAVLDFPIVRADRQDLTLSARKRPTRLVEAVFVRSKRLAKLLGPSARLRVTGLRPYRLPAAGAPGTAYMSRRCRLLLLSGSLQGQLRNYRRAAMAVFTSCAARKGRNKRERAAAVVFAMSVTVRLATPPGSRPHSYLRPSPADCSWHNPRPAG
ncbi:hypothetical protein ACVWZK_008635 [Bradyrhizobium sp. GM0.4]